MSILSYFPARLRKFLSLNVSSAIAKKDTGSGPSPSIYKSKFYKNDITAVTHFQKPISMNINHEG